MGDYLVEKEKMDQKTYEVVQKSKKTGLDEEIIAAPMPTEPYSVLMSLYIKEKPKYLELAIQSMIEQTYQPNEIVIVKDGQITPELEEVLNYYCDAYPDLFRIVGYPENRGFGLALDFGLEQCRNEFIARMDTDDISKPDRCEKQMKAFLLHPDYAIIGSAVDEFYGETTNITGRRAVPATPKAIYEFAKRRSAFNHPSVMYKKSRVLEFGGYRDLRRNQDVDLFGRMLFGGCKAGNFKQSLLWFRSDENLAKRRKSWENTWSYIDTIRRFHKMGYSNWGDVVIVAGAQTGMFLMPVKVQDWIYRNFLRK